MSSRKVWFLLSLILLFALSLRLTGLGWGLPSKTLSLTTYHPDESYLFQAFENMYRTRSLDPGKAGLFYGTFYFYLSGAVLGVSKLAGFIQIGSRDFLLSNLANLDRVYLSVRSFSVLCGVLTVLGSFYLGKKIGGERVGLWSAFFMAVSPVAIGVSHYAKVDVMPPLLLVFLLLLCIRLVKEPSVKEALFCGLVAGLMASTKYNSGIFLLTVFTAVLLSPSEKKWKLVLAAAAASFIGFVIATPYAVLNFPLFIEALGDQFGALSGGVGLWDMQQPNGFWRYGTFYIPFGMGWPCWILCLFGIGVAVVSIASRKENARPLILCLVSFILMGFLLGSAGLRFANYTSPLLPPIVIFAALAADWIGQKMPRAFAVICVFLIVSYQSLYAVSFAKLYTGPDPRELAGQWLETNIPHGGSVGIIRSYFWTPGILRREDPPYIVSKGGHDRENFQNSVLGLDQMSPLPEVFVASELETREFYRIERTQPAYAEVLRGFFMHYDPVAEFELKPGIEKLPFWRRTPPWDFSMISPTVKVYRKKP